MCSGVTWWGFPLLLTGQWLPAPAVDRRCQNQARPVQKTICDGKHCGTVPNKGQPAPQQSPPDFTCQGPGYGVGLCSLPHLW